MSHSQLCNLSVIITIVVIIHSIWNKHISSIPPGYWTIYSCELIRGFVFLRKMNLLSDPRLLSITHPMCCVKLPHDPRHQNTVIFNQIMFWPFYRIIILVAGRMLWDFGTVNILVWSLLIFWKLTIQQELRRIIL